MLAVCNREPGHDPQAAAAAITAFHAWIQAGISEQGVIDGFPDVDMRDCMSLGCSVTSTAMAMMTSFATCQTTALSQNTKKHSSRAELRSM
jgi:hypothetical protein